MPIRIVVDKEYGRSKPVVICDYCHKEIINASNGNCLWDRVDISMEFRFTHKKCDEAFEKENIAETSWKATGLDLFIYRLALNTNLDWEQADQTAEMLGRHF